MTSTPPPFGRRQGRAHHAPTPTARPQAVRSTLSPPAEAFRAELAASGGGGPDGFAAWRKEQAAKRRLAWFATFALLTPGVFLLGVKAPAGVSASVEACGLAASWWLRRERRRHLKAIADWRLEGEA